MLSSKTLCRIQQAWSLLGKTHNSVCFCSQVLWISLSKYQSFSQQSPRIAQRETLVEQLLANDRVQTKMANPERMQWSVAKGFIWAILTVHLLQLVNQAAIWCTPTNDAYHQTNTIEMIVLFSLFTKVAASPESQKVKPKKISDYKRI